MKNTYEIYPGLALVRLRTTGPWITDVFMIAGVTKNHELPESEVKNEIHIKQF